MIMLLLLRLFAVSFSLSLLLLLLFLFFSPVASLLVTCYSRYSLSHGDGWWWYKCICYYQCFTRLNFKYSTFSREVFKRLARMYLNSHKYYDRSLICWSNVEFFYCFCCCFLYAELYLLWTQTVVRASTTKKVTS